MDSFPNLEPVCSISGSNCCFLTCIQISQEAGKVVWYSHHFKNIGDWNAKLGGQEILGVIGNFDLGVHNEAGQRLTEFCQENSLVVVNTLFHQHKRRLFTWTSPGRCSILKSDFSDFFAAKDGKALYSQEKQHWVLTVGQIMNSLLANSDVNRRKQEKPLNHSGMT